MLINTEQIKISSRRPLGVSWVIETLAKLENDVDDLQYKQITKCLSAQLDDCFQRYREIVDYVNSNNLNDYVQNNIYRIRMKLSNINRQISDYFD